MISNSKKDLGDSKEFQASLRKYPSSKSIHLIDYFLIIGYEETFIQEKIIKSIQNIDFTTNNNKYKCEEYPTVLSSVNSDYAGDMMDEEDIIKYIFPESPNIPYSKGDNLEIDIKEKNIIFSKVEDNLINIGYAYIFYEFLTMPNRTKIYIPKVFVIISQYPFFYYI